jgi:hypothetical protein
MSSVQAEVTTPIPFYKTVKRVSALTCAVDLTDLRQKFQDVELEPGVDTPQFCEAVDAVIAFFGKSSSTPSSVADELYTLLASRYNMQHPPTIRPSILSSRQRLD